MFSDGGSVWGNTVMVTIGVEQANAADGAFGPTMAICIASLSISFVFISHRPLVPPVMTCNNHHFLSHFVSKSALRDIQLEASEHSSDFRTHSFLRWPPACRPSSCVKLFSLFPIVYVYVLLRDDTYTQSNN